MPPAASAHRRTLTAHEHPLIKVFSSDFDFLIPEYQRPYRWGTEQALQLLADLEETLERQPDDPYFLGSLVLVEGEGNQYEVIDGQQRLTTLTILFAVLRDLSEGELAGELRDLILEPGRTLSGLAPKPRLTLRAQDRTFFESYIQQAGRTSELVSLHDGVTSTEPQRSIRDNARVVRQTLSGWTQEKRQSLAQLASTRTYLVLVTTPDLTSAHRIFSVMNARGLDLSPTDIFKSQVIGSIDDEGAARRWEDIEESLGSDDFTDLFRDIRTIVTVERARRDLLREFPEQVLDGYREAGRTSDFLDGVLLPYSRAFEATVAFNLGPGREWVAINDYLKRLAAIDNKDWRPVALWMLHSHPNEPVLLAEFFRALERLASYFLLTGEYTTPRVARYLDVLREVKAGLGVDAPSLALSEAEQHAARAALDGEVYRMQTRRARYVLLRLDEVLANSPGSSYNHSIISIEHVLPQKPAEGSGWQADFTEEQRVYWTHRLGNLLLLNHRKNSQARNFEFETKKRSYFSTSTGSAVFALTTQVLRESEWTPEVVAARQQQLVDVLAREWDLT